MPKMLVIPQTLIQYQPHAGPRGHNGDQNQTWPLPSKGLLSTGGKTVAEESHNYQVRLEPPGKAGGL